MDGTTLHMDTISPGGGLISGVNLYKQNVSINVNPFTIEVTARVLQAVGDGTSEWINPFGFGFALGHIPIKRFLRVGCCDSRFPTVGVLTWRVLI